MSIAKIARILSSNGRHLWKTERTPLVETRATFSVTRDNFEAEKVTFARLLRNSPLVKLGPPEGKVVIGKIVDTVEDDLYVDFGFKFKAVCMRPKQNGENYIRGSHVKVRINSLELSDRFLGSTKDLTLLEADVTLLGLVSSPCEPPKSTEQFKASDIF